MPQSVIMGLRVAGIILLACALPRFIAVGEQHRDCRG